MTTFTIHGKPYGKKRPRFSRKTGRAYDPKENGEFENTVAGVALRHFPHPIIGPVMIEIVAQFVPAPSWSKKRRAEAIGTPHMQKPDIDNVGKAICDGLNRIAFADDSQIADMIVRKRWGTAERTIVSVVPL